MRSFLPLACGAAIGILVTVAATGTILWNAFAPDATNAHRSVLELAGGSGAFARSSHWWAATLALVVTTVAYASWWLASATGPPRPILGVVLLSILLVLAGSFLLGGWLPMDQRAAESYSHARALLASLGFSPPTLPVELAFWAHALALPMVLALLTFFFVRAKPQTRPPWTGLLASAVIVALLVAGLALVWSPPVGPSPISGLTLSRPEWPFRWIVPFEQLFGPPGLLAAALVPLALFVASLRASRFGTRARFVLLGSFTGSLLVLGAWEALL